MFHGDFDPDDPSLWLCYRCDALVTCRHWHPHAYPPRPDRLIGYDLSRLKWQFKHKAKEARARKPWQRNRFLDTLAAWTRPNTSKPGRTLEVGEHSRVLTWNVRAPRALVLETKPVSTHPIIERADRELFVGLFGPVRRDHWPFGLGGFAQVWTDPSADTELRRLASTCEVVVLGHSALDATTHAEWDLSRWVFDERAWSRIDTILRLPEVAALDQSQIPSFAGRWAPSLTPDGLPQRDVWLDWYSKRTRRLRI
jgi:hypothetical protein